MHPAPSLAEAPPKADNQQVPPSPGPGGQGQHTPSASPPMRKDTLSSTSTTTTIASAATIASSETLATAYSLDSSSPSFISQAATFSVKDGVDILDSRRGTRRRTGPLSAEQREKAALIRKLGACSDCRRRRVACHPNHHNMTWEDAMRKYRSHSPGLPELAPLAGRPLSPVPLNSSIMYNHSPHDMEVDSTPTQHTPGRPAVNDPRLRTPLPSGPRLEKPVPPLPSPLPAIEGLRPDLQSVASRIISNPHRTRYSAVRALLLYWQDDADPRVDQAIRELGEVLEKHYHYTFELQPIPTASDGCKSSWRWLSQRINRFVEDQDHRDVLKIIYYNGHSFLDENREMVLASPTRSDVSSCIRWSGIQQILEDACSDTFVIMDAAYYPSSKMVRHQGVFELIAASVSDDHMRAMDRGAFTRALTDTLQTRANQRFLQPLSAAGLHAKLLSQYPQMIHERFPERERLASFPFPLHMQMSGNPRLASIQLAPLHKTFLPPFGGGGSSGEGADQGGGPVMNLSIRLTDDALNMESWTEWLRMMPEGVRDVKIEGPFRGSFR